MKNDVFYIFQKHSLYHEQKFTIEIKLKKFNCSLSIVQ
jgi:hypothetical protein